MTRAAPRNPGNSAGRGWGLCGWHVCLEGGGGWGARGGGGGGMRVCGCGCGRVCRLSPRVPCGCHSSTATGRGARHAHLLVGASSADDSLSTSLSAPLPWGPPQRPVPAPHRLRPLRALPYAICRVPRAARHQPRALDGPLRHSLRLPRGLLLVGGWAGGRAPVPASGACCPALPLRSMCMCVLCTCVCACVRVRGRLGWEVGRIRGCGMPAGGRGGLGEACLQSRLASRPPDHPAWTHTRICSWLGADSGNSARPSCVSPGRHPRFPLGSAEACLLPGPPPHPAATPRTRNPPATHPPGSTCWYQSSLTTTPGWLRSRAICCR